jgi:hypothetical protein
MNNQQKKAKVSLQDFVQAWETSNSLQEVADKTGMNAASISARAAKCRKDYNLPLKQMHTNRVGRINTKEARAFLAELRGVSVEVIEQEAKAIMESQAAKKAA